VASLILSHPERTLAQRISCSQSSEMGVLTFVGLFFASSVIAQKGCSVNLPPATTAPIVASGFTARVFANGLTKPRGMVFDTEGNLLVVQNGRGIIAIKLKDDGGSCVSAAGTQSVVADTSVSSTYKKVIYWLCEWLR
jgi:glucose/arabinose dehydrogenase